jgi:hypothetical protein
MHRLLPSIVLAAVLLLGSAASAVTLASRFTALSDEVTARLDALPDSGLSKDEKKLKSSLGKAVKALTKDTDDLFKTMKNGRKVALRLDGAYPDDATLAPLLDDLVTTLSVDVVRRGAGLNNATSFLPDGTAKVRAQKFNDAAELEIVAADAETVRAERLAHLAAAAALILKGEKVVAKAGGNTLVRSELDVDIDGLHLHLPPETGQYLYVASYDPEANVFFLTANGTVDSTTHLFRLQVPGASLGSHAIDGGSPTVYMSPQSPGPIFTLVDGATMTFTTWDPAGSRFAGTFSASFTNGTKTVALTNGSFTSVN